MTVVKVLNVVKRWSLPACMILGVLVAFGIVLAWFPGGSEIWNLPLQEVDAPAHYYFIRKILSEGIGAATHLWPNDAYYPPLFHLMAAGLIKLAALFGVTMNIYTAVNVVWLFGAGILWPAGVQLLAWYWTRGVDARLTRIVPRRHMNCGYSPTRTNSPAGLSTNDVASRSAMRHSGEAADSGIEESAQADQSQVIWRPFACAMAVIVPILSVSSASHPFFMLANGPLLAYGLATSLLPFWLFVTLKLFDAISQRNHILPWLVATLILGGLCIFAHPRIVFTWLLLMAPFVLTRLPWRLIVGLGIIVLAGAVAFYFFMTATYKSSRYLNPASWFHTFVANRSVPEAIWVFVSSNISGIAGGFMALMTVVAASIGIFVILKPRRFGVARRDAISLICAWALVGLVYVCSTAITGWFANIVTAAWYRSEPRPMTMIPLGVLPLLVFAVSAIAGFDGRANGDVPSSVAAQAEAVGEDEVADASEAVGNVSETFGTANEAADTAKALDDCAVASQSECAVASIQGENADVPHSELHGDEANIIGQEAEADVTNAASEAGHIAAHSLHGLPLQAWVALVLVAALAIACQFGNTAREDLSATGHSRVLLHNEQPDEQLTAAKYEVLQDVSNVVGSQSVVISDPLNGSMYGMAAFGTNMLYPIYNPMAEGNGAIFGQVEQAFDSGNDEEVLNTVCPIGNTTPEYFLSMGPQAPSLQMFTFREQYDPFHRTDLIDQYIADGTLTMVRDYSYLGDFAQGWALYRFGCAQ